MGYVSRAMGVGPLHQVVGSEVVPLEIAARGKAIYAMARRASAMLFCLFFPPLLDSLGGELMFAGLAAITFLYFLAVFLRLPETKGPGPARRSYTTTTHSPGRRRSALCQARAGKGPLDHSQSSTRRAADSAQSRIPGP
jgi:hypothetical protein